jgi:hypothetical protein
MLRTTRRNGYATRLNEPFMQRTSSIAVPILVDGRASACVTVVWLTSAMPPNRAIKQLTPLLRQAAAEIAQKVGGAGLIFGFSAAVAHRGNHTSVDCEDARASGPVERAPSPA